MTNTSANWVLGKRLFHWGLALAVLVALLAPKPEDGEGLLHRFAGTVALALVLARLGWRLLGDVRPHVKDAWRVRIPDISKGLRGFAPLLMQGARLGGFAFLVLVPVAAGLALVGIGQGGESPFLEAHEAAGAAIMFLAIAHAIAICLFALMVRFDLFRITLFGGSRSFLEGGARGVLGLALGVAIGVATLAYVWGPFDLASKASALTEQGESGGEDEAGESN